VVTSEKDDLRKRFKRNEKYARLLQINLMNICENLVVNGGEQFVRDVVPGGPYDRAPGWELSIELDPEAVEQDQEGFFNKVSDFMTPLTHKTLKDSNGEKMKVLHDLNELKQWKQFYWSKITSLGSVPIRIRFYKKLFLF